MKKVAVLQSSYIPWKGYFDIIHDVDEFVFYDEVQFTVRDWRSRNYVYGKNGLILLSLSCLGGRNQAIRDVKIQPIQKHFKTISQTYSKSAFFDLYADFLSKIYSKDWLYLSDLNQHIIKVIAKDFLGIHTKFSISSDYKASGSKHEKLLNLVKATGASVYVSGPAAKNYIIEQDYTDNGIEIMWKNYSNYPQYSQLNSKFLHNVSVLDVLFNCGEEAPFYIWGWRNK